MILWLLNHLPDAVFHFITLVGLGVVVLSQLPLIPIKVAFRNAGIAVLALGLFFEGSISNNNDWKAKVAEQEAAEAQRQAQSATVTTKTIVKYVDRIREVEKKGEKNEAAVAQYVPPAVDAACSINNGFVVLHNAAAGGTEVPGSAGASNEEASGVKLSEVETTVVQNYNTYHKVKAQLEELQDWLIQQRDIYNKK